MLKPPSPLRLLLELLVIVALAEFVVTLALNHLAPGMRGARLAAWHATALVWLSAPGVFWRCVSATRYVVAVDDSQGRVSMRQALAWAIAAQVLMLCVTAAATKWQYDLVQARTAERFEQHLDRIEADVLRRFEKPLYGLRGLLGTYAASTEVTRSEFRAHTEARNLDTEFPGVRGFGFIERVLRRDIDWFVARERADAAPDFTITTTGSASDLYVIKYIEPLTRNFAARGLDVGAEAVRREAVERAVRTGEPALTGRITLVQDGKKGPGFLYLVPVYRVGADPATPAQRQAMLRGLVYAPIAMAELMQGVSAAADDMVDVEIFEGSEANADQVLLDLDGHLEGKTGLLDLAQTYAGRFHVRQREIRIGGRTLLLLGSSTDKFDRTGERAPVAITVLTGTALSFAVAFLVWLMAAGRARAQLKAQQMTADLSRLATVVRHTSNRVVITDANGKIAWVNHAYEKATGQLLVALSGSTPAELSLPERGKPHPSQARLRAAMVAGESFQGEITSSCTTGQTCWLEVDMQVLRDAQGQLSGHMLIESDVTERVATTARLQVALREGHALLQTLNAHAIVSVTDRNGFITEVNDGFCKVSGYSRDELLGKNHHIVNSGMHPPSYWAEFWQTISEGKPWRGEVCNRAKDGQLYWVDSMVAPFMGDDGFVEKYISIRTDITVNKAAQLTLKRTTDQLQLAIEGGSDGLWDWVNVYGQEQWWSPQFYRLLGYEPGEIEASLVTFDAMLHPDQHERTFSAIGEALQGKQSFDVEYQLKTHSGEYRWFRARAKVYFDAAGDAQRMAGSIQDIHERKQADAALSETSSLLRSVLASTTGLSVVAITTGRKISVFNRGAQRLLGYRESEMVGVETPALIHDPAERLALAQSMSQALGRPVLPEHVFMDDSVLGRARECTYVHRDGTHIPVSLTVTAMTNSAGDLFGYVGVAQDIRERKKFETSLQEARERAEQASAAKSQFLANMSHEIRTPMNAILGMLRLLQGTPLTPRQLDYASKTEGAARSLLHLLNDILDFSKAEAGKMVLDPQPFALDRLLRDLSVILSANVGKKQIEVLFELDPALPTTVVGDSMRLQQVLINLGGNAIKFTEHGEVHVKLRVAERTEHEVAVEFSIRDTGIGIAPENQKSIFAGFTQAEASTTRRYGGTGLGLVISRHMVELMGGELHLESAVGVGTCFRFTVRLPAPAEEGAQLPSARPGSGLRALVVDDNPLARSILASMARTLGWQVDAVASGTEALARTQQGSATAYDVVFVDWLMPVMDGWETAQRLRARDSGASAPLVIMVTANNTAALAQRSEQEQALLDGFLVKPVTPSMLYDAVIDARTLRADPNARLLAQAHTGKRLNGLRVLVVEDNLNNQQVAQELLSEEGATITLASNGQEGIDAVLREKPAFDAVLMDLQMPVMDGLTAARRLRELPAHQHLPIIAMTANAMASDREACLAAGMNDHVGKPFDLDQLVATLLRRTGRASPATASPAREAAALPEALIAYATEQGLELHAALQRLGGNAQAYLRVLRSFAQDLLPLPDTLAEHLGADRRVDALRLLHTLKGMAGTVGLPALAKVAAAGETRLRAHPDAQEASATVAALRSASQAAQAQAQHVIEALSAAVAAHASKPTPAGAPAHDPAALARDLTRLSDLLRQADMQALDVHAHIQSTYAHHLGDAMQALDDAMAGLDFARAHALCRVLQENTSEHMEPS